MKAYAERLAKAAPERFYVFYGDHGWIITARIMQSGLWFACDQASHEWWGLWGPLAEERGITSAQLNQDLPLLEALADAVCRSFVEEQK